MNENEKLEELKLMIAPDVVEEDVLRSLIRRSERIVLNRRYPFGYTEDTVVEKRFEGVQLDIALELYAKRGVEGQTGHNEGGINRTYETGTVSSSLLKRIMPLVGSVKSND